MTRPEDCRPTLPAAFEPGGPVRRRRRPRGGACLGLGAGAFLRAAGGAPPTATPEPTALPAVAPAGASATVPPVEPPATPVASDDLARGAEAERLVVGTSLDNPPFSFYSPAFEPDGFDIAVIRALGERLDLEVAIRDVAFGGLAGALHVGQVDAALAAISVSPARAARMDFTEPHFVGDEAALVRDDGPPVITLGDCVRLQWAVAGHVYQVRLLHNGAALREDAPLRGSLDHCPDRRGTAVYRLEATGPGGTSREERSVQVKPRKALSHPHLS